MILCKLANVLKPGSVDKINTGNLAFKQMENINKFLEAARALGVRAADLFQTVDLYEGANMTQVCGRCNALRGNWGSCRLTQTVADRCSLSFRC